MTKQVQTVMAWSGVAFVVIFFAGFIVSGFFPPFLPATALPFFYDGLFAWNGLLTFWMAAVFFGSFYLVMSYACLRAVKRQYAPGSSEAESGVPSMQPA
jgi:hypothetical protein